MELSSLPKIQAALLHCTYVNGGINRHRTEAMWYPVANVWLSFRDMDNVRHLEAWLATLTEEQIEHLVDGEQGDIEAMLKCVPPTLSSEWVDKFFNDFFEEVV